MYLSVLARMVNASKKDILENIPKENDRKIAKILIDFQDRDHLKNIKDIEILNEDVNQKSNIFKNS